MVRIDELRSVPLRRNLRDRTRSLVVGAVLLTVAWLVIAMTRSGLTAGERRVFRVVNDLPDALGHLLEPVMWFGTLWAVVVVAIAALAVYRRGAPAAAVAIGGWVAYVLAQVVKSIVERGRPDVFLHVLHLRADAHGAGFTSGHAAVAAATVAALGPWLGRRGRIVAWVVAGAVALARVFVGVHLPLDVVGGVGLGILCGACTTTAVGTPEVTSED